MIARIVSWLNLTGSVICHVFPSFVTFLPPTEAENMFKIRPKTGSLGRENKHYVINKNLQVAPPPTPPLTPVKNTLGKKE